MDQEQGWPLGAFTKDELIMLSRYAQPNAEEAEREWDEFDQLLQSLRDEDLEANLQWLCEARDAGRLSDDARRVLDIVERDVLKRQAIDHLISVRSERIHRERYAKLEAHYLRIVGVGLNSQQRYARWIEQLEDHLLFITSSPEEIERFKEDLVRRIEHYRSRTKHRRTRWRRLNSLNHTEEYRRSVVLDYKRYLDRGKPRWVAAPLVGGDHKPDTIEKWAKKLGIELGIDGI